VLAGLLKAEMAACGIRSLAYEMKVAPLPVYWNLNGFDFGCSDFHEATVCELHRCEFVTSAQNVVLVADPAQGNGGDSGGMHTSNRTRSKPCSLLLDH
jgi:hypothetical protein